MELLRLALAPILICLFYIYIKDKCKKEPLKMLFVCLFWGFLATVPIVFVERFVESLMPKGAGNNFEAFYTAFFIASLVEEGFKFLILILIAWKSKYFDERFDSIVYAVFISLGFAMFENVLYVFDNELGGVETAYMRAIFSIPGHAFFAVSMGYYCSKAKFEGHKFKNLFLALFVPFLFHGVYDFCLMTDILIFNYLFYAFVVLLWINGFKKIRQISKI